MATESTESKTPADDAAAAQRARDLRLAFAQPFEPLFPDQDSYRIPRDPAPPTLRCSQGLPVPTTELRLGYGADEQEYLRSGETDIASMQRILDAAGGFSWDDTRAVLDFGCGAGRMLRWLAPHAPRVELWGVDVGAERILWCRRNLSPPLHFSLTTIHPHLPFEDRRFDLVYAGSVFTHLDDLAMPWLLELKRVIRPGGRLFITVHDRHTLEWLQHHPEYWLTRDLRRVIAEQPDLDFHDFAMITVGRSRLSQVFYSDAFLHAMLEPSFRILSSTPYAHGYQTGILLERR